MALRSSVMVKTLHPIETVTILLTRMIFTLELILTLSKICSTVRSIDRLQQTTLSSPTNWMLVKIQARLNTRWAATIKNNSQPTTISSHQEALQTSATTMLPIITPIHLWILVDLKDSERQPPLRDWIMWVSKLLTLMIFRLALLNLRPLKRF